MKLCEIHGFHNDKTSECGLMG